MYNLNWECTKQDIKCSIDLVVGSNVQEKSDVVWHRWEAYSERDVIAQYPCRPDAYPSRQAVLETVKQLCNVSAIEWIRDK
jgi:hypothetical protein